MRYELHTNGVSVAESLEKAINHKVEKVRDRLKRYHPEAAELEVRLGHLERANEYECSLKLSAFKDTLAAKKSAAELRVAVDRSFDALLKEMEHYRSKINKSLHP